MDFLHNPALLLFLLMAGHCIADFSFQNDHMVRAKAGHAGLVAGSELGFAEAAHGLIHGAFVGFLTGSATLGILETLAHIIIDRARARGQLGYSLDQVAHVGCKVLWFVAILACPTLP